MRDSSKEYFLDYNIEAVFLHQTCAGRDLYGAKTLIHSENNKLKTININKLK